jgi:membrane fusion protein (multidrug efflux system)
MMKLFKTLALACSALLLVLSISGCQVLPDSQAASHTSYPVSKPLVKDPALLKTNAHKAEFWDTPSSLVAHVVALAKAATGQPPSAGLKDEEASHTSYEVSKPLVKDLTMNDEYVCQIRAIQHIEVRSLEKGYLQNVLIDEGDTVRQGQLLFQIKPTVYQADVQKSEAEVELSKIELQNNQALADKDIISVTEASMSAAKLAKVQAELELAKTHLGFTEIRAPFDGLVGRFGDIRLGSLLEENQLLTTLSDMHRLWVYFNVPEAVYLDYMEHRRNGGSKYVQLELANKEIYPEPGTIEVIQSDFNSTSGNIAFRASFNNPHSLLRYGQTGTILWPKKINQAVIVPQKSTFEVLDKRFIFVVDKTGVIHEREIKVAREEPNIYILASGITPDEMFLLERQNKLDKGDKIRYKLIDPQSAIANLKLYAE